MVISVSLCYVQSKGKNSILLRNFANTPWLSASSESTGLLISWVEGSPIAQEIGVQSKVES